jgi:hypothetical protein
MFQTMRRVDRVGAGHQKRRREVALGVAEIERGVREGEFVVQDVAVVAD